LNCGAWLRWCARTASARKNDNNYDDLAAPTANNYYDDLAAPTANNYYDDLAAPTAKRSRGLPSPAAVT